MNWIDEKIKEFENACCPLVGDEPLPEVCIPLGDVQREEVKTFLRTALEEAHTKGTQEALKPFKGALNPGEWEDSVWHDGKNVGTQEALAKVEEWVKKNQHQTVYETPATYTVDLLHHLQQLKDNKTV